MNSQINLEKLKGLYELAKNHPYRVYKTGSAKSYSDILEELHDEFIKQLKISCKENNIQYPFFPDGRWIWDHQFASSYFMLDYEQKHQDEKLFNDCHRDNLIMIEHYLGTIHGFIDANGILVTFWMDIGYTEGNNPNWVYNPRRALRFVYYPQFKKWDLTRFHATKELIYNLEELERHEKSLEKNKNSEYYKRSIKYDKKRIQELKEILAIEQTPVGGD